MTTINSDQNKNAKAQAGERQNRPFSDTGRIPVEANLTGRSETGAAAAAANSAARHIKHVNISMLDSQSVISPAVCDKKVLNKEVINKEVLKISPVAPGYINSYDDDNDREEPRFSQPVKLSYIGAGLVLLAGCVLAGVFFFSAPAPAASQPVISDESKVVSNIKNYSTTAEIRRETANKKNPAPAANVKSSTESKRDSHGQPAEEKPARENPASTSDAQQDDKQDDTNRQSDAPADSSNARDELNTSLNNWVSATNARNVDQQMNQYAPKVGSYYRSRNASKEAVRNEKKRVFEDADAVDVQVSNPNITIGPDGRTATMRFRKKYAIKKGQNNRNGEVLQEMKWIKSDSGWKIVGERDVKVIH